MGKITPGLVKSLYLASLNSKALNFYPSRLALIRPAADCLVPFEVRYCPALAAKRAETATNKPAGSTPSVFNPFLPFDRSLFIDWLDESSEYALIFNKYCIIPEHLLIITKAFIPQAAPLSAPDFVAVDTVLRSVSVADDIRRPFAFYNSGPEAGASQLHRHFQVIHLESIPIEPHVVNDDSPVDQPFSIPLFASFRHGCFRPSDAEFSSIDWYAHGWEQLRAYCQLDQNEAYNLVWTSSWMLLVPRRKEFTDDTLNSLNAMAFAGHLLVMDERQLTQLDILASLRQVTFPVQRVGAETADAATAGMRQQACDTDM